MFSRRRSARRLSACNFLQAATVSVVLVATGRLVTVNTTSAWVGTSQRERPQSFTAKRASEEEVDDTNVELFRQSLIQGWGGGEVGSGPGDQSDWAELLDTAAVRAGDVLLAHPAMFFGDGPDRACSRVGLRGRFPEDLPQSERLRMLPVVLITEVDEDSREASGVWLTMRTGRLMGDYVNHFHSRPLLYGGPSEASLMMVHPYPQVQGSEPLEGGLYVGGNFSAAQEWVEEGEGSSLRFRFFMNRIHWEEGELASELKLGSGQAWLPLRCSADLVLSESDAIGERPLWIKMAELAGGEVLQIGLDYGLIDDDDGFT